MMGPTLEEVAARHGWMLTNDPDGYSILVAIDTPADHEAKLADDDEAAEAFRQALDAREPYALAALAELLTWAPGPDYVLDLLGGEPASRAYVRAFSLSTVDGSEPLQAVGRLVMVGSQPLAGEACRLLPQHDGLWQVIVAPGEGGLIAANHAAGAELVCWTVPAGDRLAGSREFDGSWDPSSVVLVPVVSLETSLAATTIRDALRQAGIDVATFRVDRAGGNVATIMVGSVAIGPGLYDPAVPECSTFDFDHFVLVGAAASDRGAAVASIEDLVAAVRSVEQQHRPRMRRAAAGRQGVEPRAVARPGEGRWL